MGVSRPPSKEYGLVSGVLSRRQGGGSVSSSWLTKIAHFSVVQPFYLAFCAVRGHGDQVFTKRCGARTWVSPMQITNGRCGPMRR